MNAGAHGHGVAIDLDNLSHDLSRAFVTGIKLETGHDPGTAGVAVGNQPVEVLGFRLLLQEVPQRAQQQEERGQTLLAVDDLVVVLLVGRRHQHGTDEVFACRAHIDLLTDVLQQLMHFLVRPDVLALVVRDDVEALPEGFLDAVLVVFYSCHAFIP